MRTLPVELPGSEYKIEIGAGNLQDSCFPPSVSLIRNGGDRDELHSGTILPSPNQKLLEPEGYQNDTCILPDGEEYKTWKHSNGFTIS